MIIVCVLKSGGCYDFNYVKNLYRQASSCFPDSAFVCFTDFGHYYMEDNITLFELEYGLPGWWSKLEIFDLKESPVLYFDLDTLILKPFDLPELEDGEIYMMKPFRDIPGRWLSGCMYFKGDFSFLLKEFIHNRYQLQAHFSKGGDQDYINHKLKLNNITPKSFNNLAKVQSYKWQALNGPDEDTNIVCFHGKPRPHEVEKGWITEIWKTK